MKKIIDGKAYNTATADEVCEITPHDHRNLYTSDFTHETTHLYKTEKGQWFIAGSGGALTRWATRNGNGRLAGDGLKLVTDDEAKEFLEEFGSARIFEQYFAVEEG